MGRIEMYDLTSSGLTTATTAYTSGDMLGAQMTLPMGKGYGSPRVAGQIIGVTVTDDSDVIGAIELFFFSASTTPAADNAANAWSDADWQQVLEGYRQIFADGAKGLGIALA